MSQCPKGCNCKQCREARATVKIKRDNPPVPINNPPVPITSARDKNALCPCGSGAKFKKCCMNSATLAVLTPFPMFGRRRLATARAKLKHPELNQVPKGAKALIIDAKTGEKTQVQL